MQLSPNKIKSYQVTAGQYLITIMMVVLYTIFLINFRDDLTSHSIAMLYLLPVLVSAALWGYGTGITTAVLSFLAFNYFFLPPYHTLVVRHWQDIFVLLIFLVISILISNLVGRANTNLAAARQREQKLRILYDHSMALSRVSSLDDIAQVIIDQCQQTFQADCVQICLQPQLIQRELIVSSPRNVPVPTTLPGKIAPLQTSQTLWGEIRVWRKSSPLDQSDDQALQTFAAQGALALERAALAEAQNRAEVLEKSDQLKSALLHSVSHELRTPLASIKAAVTGLLSKEVEWDSQASHELLSVVDEETDHLNRLVGNLLDMSRIEAGALNPDRRWNDVLEILEQALKDTRRSLKDFRVQIDIPDNLPLMQVDFLQIERVLVNLLSNCVKFSPPGSLIRIQAEYRSESGLHLELTNEGPQIPEEDLIRIFDKFHRLTNMQGVTGTGLGLSICKGIIEAHEGQIWASNLPNGLAFHIVLPAHLASHSDLVIPPDKEGSDSGEGPV